LKLSFRGIVVTTLLALGAGFGGVWLGMKALAPAPARSMHDVVHHRLDLSGDQLARIETLESAFAAREHALELEMRSANAELAAAIREEHENGPRVAAAVERFHDAMGRLQTETIAHMFAMREVLNDEQKAIFDDTVVEALTAEPQ
jgi:Spy/CpxP family protein refolding chaperone